MSPSSYSEEAIEGIPFEVLNARQNLGCLDREGLFSRDDWEGGTTHATTRCAHSAAFLEVKKGMKRH